MKLIALKNFRNVGNKIQLENAVHPDHIHKGAIFDIGTASDLKTLRKQDREAAEFVAMLVFAGSVGDANDPKVVKAVADEIAVDAKREARFKDLDDAASVMAVGTQWNELFQQLARVKQAVPSRAK